MQCDAARLTALPAAALQDEIGRQMMLAVGDACRLRHEHTALRLGWANTLHEDRPNGVMVGAPGNRMACSWAADAGSQGRAATAAAADASNGCTAVWCTRWLASLSTGMRTCASAAAPLSHRHTH
jgi:hypothetical protein